MKRIPIEVLEHVQDEMPEIVDAIQRKGRGPIVLVFDDFTEQPDLFYNAVWYASSNGRQVVICPSH